VKQTTKNGPALSAGRAKKAAQRHESPDQNVTSALTLAPRDAKNVPFIAPPDASLLMIAPNITESVRGQNSGKDAVT